MQGGGRGVGVRGGVVWGGVPLLHPTTCSIHGAHATRICRRTRSLARAVARLSTCLVRRRISLSRSARPCGVIRRGLTAAGYKHQVCAIAFVLVEQRLTIRTEWVHGPGHGSLSSYDRDVLRCEATQALLVTQLIPSLFL